MYKRSWPPLIDFINISPPKGKYAVDTQFGRIGFCSSDVSPTISTRVCANDCTFIIEVSDVQEEYTHIDGVHENQSP